MKKCFLVCTIIAILLTPILALGQKSTKIGLIDLQRCLHESKEGKKAIQRLKKGKDDLQIQLDTKQQELLELRKELEKQAMMLTMDAQEDKRRAIERKTRELEYFYKDLNEKMKKVRGKEKKRILNELGKIIEKIGSEGNYTLIMEKKAGGVLYSTDSIDITEEVIRAYDQTKEQDKE